MATSSLSDEEFQRLQIQLLELRTANYTLEDKCAKQEKEVAALRAQINTLDRDYQKAKNAVNKSKKAKEFDLMMTENDAMQRKLMSQEQEFQLQNETLMKELSRLVTTNEQLELEIKENNSNNSAEQHCESTSDAEIRRLNAQNTALQKSLQEIRDKYDAEISKLGESNSNETIDDENITSCSKVELSSQLNELQLNLNVEKEENRLLREQLDQFHQESDSKIKTLSEEVEKLSSKFKKKQESFVHLQEEKENQYSELTKKLEELQKNKENEIISLKEQCERLHEELGRSNKHLEEHQLQSSDQINSLQTELNTTKEKLKIIEEQDQKAAQRILELEGVVMSLEEEVDEGNAEQRELMQREMDQVTKKLQQAQAQLQVVNSTVEDLTVQLKESRNNHSEAIEQLRALQEDRDKQIQGLQEMKLLAEKRKSLLDELAIKYQKESDQHRQQVQTMTEDHGKTVDNLSSQLKQLKLDLEAKHDDEVQSLTAQISSLEATTAEMATVQAALEDTKAELRSTAEAKSWLERRLAEVEESFEKCKEEHDIQKSEWHTNHEEEISKLKEEHTLHLEEVQQEVNRLNEEKTELDATIVKLRQEIKDTFDARKIHEKKGMTVVKDLKKQLVGERKRAEKLQERLQELLSDGKGRQSSCVDDLLKSSSDVNSYRGDEGSSISSWSGISKDQSAMSGCSPDEEERTPSASMLEQENADLLQRVAETQDKMWTLEEKVSHLEASNAAMADDLLRKTAIIEHYVMEGRGPNHNNLQSPSSHDKNTLKRMVDFVKGEDENMKDMNRKLQRMLEETLTKNMHLQQDLETLSQQVVRLSKPQS